MSDPFAACEEIVRRHDPDRYFAALFAPEDKRRFLFALYALYYELAHAAEAAREPMLIEIRLMWWRETLAMAREGKARNHDVARALVETLAAVDLPDALFEAMIAARGRGPEPFADAAAAEAYGDATVGSLMRLAARVLGAQADAPVRDAAIAYALAGQSGEQFRNIDTGTVARAHYMAARKTAVPRQALPAFLPAALAPLYLKQPDPPLWRKQVSLLRAAMSGRL
jgi:phytoene/squalene synthetase